MRPVRSRKGTREETDNRPARLKIGYNIPTISTLGPGRRVVRPWISREKGHLSAKVKLEEVDEGFVYHFKEHLSKPGMLQQRHKGACQSLEIARYQALARAE